VASGAAVEARGAGVEPIVAAVEASGRAAAASGAAVEAKGSGVELLVAAVEAAGAATATGIGGDDSRGREGTWAHAATASRARVASP